MAVVDSNSPSFCRHRLTPKHLLMSSVVGWKRFRRQVTWYTLRCPGITQKSSVVDNTFLPSQ